MDAERVEPRFRRGDEERRRPCHSRSCRAPTQAPAPSQRAALESDAEKTRGPDAETARHPNQWGRNRRRHRERHGPTQRAREWRGLAQRVLGPTQRVRGPMQRAPGPDSDPGTESAGRRRRERRTPPDTERARHRERRAQHRDGRAPNPTRRAPGPETESGGRGPGPDTGSASKTSRPFCDKACNRIRGLATNPPCIKPIEDYSTLHITAD